MSLTIGAPSDIACRLLDKYMEITNWYCRLLLFSIKMKTNKLLSTYSYDTERHISQLKDSQISVLIPLSGCCPQ